MRGALRLSFGDNGNIQLRQRIRQRSNFVEWTPLVLILMILAEGMGAPAIYRHISGALRIRSASKATPPHIRCAMSATAPTFWPR